MPRSAHRQQLIEQYPSLVNGDPYFRTSGNDHLGRRIIFSRPNHTNSSGLTTARHRKVVRGTIIGFLSETDVDKSGNAAFVATKSSRYTREGEPSKLFHIVLDEKDQDNDTVVVDLEEWELDEYCEWIAGDEEEETKIVGERQKKQDLSKKYSQAKCNDECTKTTEFEKLNNLALEAAASASHASVVVETAINSANDGTASLAEVAAAGCRKCKKELETGKKVRGAHVGHCPRKGLWKSEGKLGKSDTSGKSRDEAGSQSSEKKIDSCSSGECKNEGRPDQSHARALAVAPCQSFNDFLKAALASYASSSQKKNTNNAPPPLPPPFLSHEENCTLRTALAFVMARSRNKGKISSNTSLPQGSIPTAVENNVGNIAAGRLGECWSQDHPPLVGGLLALPPRDCSSIGQMNLNASNAKIELYRELKHVRDAMNLAVSALLPSYRSTLQVKSNERHEVDGRRHCAVYDFESAAKPPSLWDSQFQLPTSEHHLATLDGLCRHIVGRLSSIANDKALRRKLAPDDEAKPDIVRDAMAQLQMDFIIDSFCLSADTAQQIHQLMASCHVLHRLLLLDENCTTLGSDCVAMTCTILTDLYHDKCIGIRNRGVSNQLRSRKGKEQGGKGKHQVVPSRWTYLASSYNANREERRKQALCATLQPCNSNGPLTGMKRSANQPHDDSAGYQQSTQLPRLEDVLAVNLLRLLEGASAIRLHFHRRYPRKNNGNFARKAATSAAAAEVLQEVRSNLDQDMLIPIHINDAAAVYYHEKMNSQEEYLRPGAKMMLRMHLFDLIQKLIVYEQG